MPVVLAGPAGAAADVPEDAGDDNVDDEDINEEDMAEDDAAEIAGWPENDDPPVELEVEGQDAAD